MKEIYLKSGLVRFDITSQFTTVPTDKAVEVTHRKLSYNDQLYGQREGTAVGSSVSAVVAN